MVALPLLSGADRMADAFDSRWSLNVRAWRMFSDSPLVGWGPGSALTWLMNDPRHYRIDGVEAHGIAQKLISEGGLLGALTGLLAWGLLLRDLARRAVEEGADRLIQGGALLGIGLQLNLLLSTDLYASTHWAPLALALAFCARRP
jgi:O-antigen ligase